MRKFLDENFLLHNKTAEKLYHQYAAGMPIIDYHCHLPPQPIAEDHCFDNLTQVWLLGDHYKWRAQRANGVAEPYITGGKTDWEKFLAWAQTVPYTLRNPLYHWTHLELQRYFQVNELLNADTARAIYDHCSGLLKDPSFSVRNLLRKMKVAALCTTDDPVDSLEFHRQLKAEGFEIPVLPAFRPDQAMNVDDPTQFNRYLGKLETVTNKNLGSLEEYLSALRDRHDYFGSLGCRVSDHGLEAIYAEDYTSTEVEASFQSLRLGQPLNEMEKARFKSYLLVQFAEWDWEKGWVQQFHLGALRNNNTRMLGQLGPDTGWDSMGDFSQGRSLSRFLNRLDSNDKLARTILYNLNPADNELMATMVGNFNDGSIPGKVQYGAAWWFMDQKDGMTRQLNALSNMGLLSRFVGMLTDSRSFLSYPRHEYFRRLLCNLLGEEMEKGELPADMEWIGKLVGDICYHNADQYFRIPGVARY